MLRYPKPKIIVSSCLGLEACRYNGEMLSGEVTDQLKTFVSLIPVCPEVAIHLGTPRPTIRLQKEEGKIKLYQPDTGLYLTEKMLDFSKGFVQQHLDCDGALLAHKSPSCGPSQVKIYEEGQPTTKGSGLFASTLMEMCPHLPIEDEGRIKNFHIREHYLIKVFSLAAFREVGAANKIDLLRGFHERNKYLMMAYSPDLQKHLGRILANHEHDSAPSLFQEYRQVFFELLQKEPSKGKTINAFEHIGGYFSKTSNPAEKAFLKENFQDYLDDKIPLRSLIVLLHGWALRDRNDYLLRQTLLAPYPKELMSMKDSGRLIEM